MLGFDSIKSKDDVQRLRSSINIHIKQVFHHSFSFALTLLSKKFQLIGCLDGFLCNKWHSSRKMVRDFMMITNCNENPHFFFQLDLSLSLGTSFNIFHHHLMFMLEHQLPRVERSVFNSLASTSAVLEFLSTNLGID